MRWTHRFTLAVFLVLVLSAGACDTTENNVRPSKAVEDLSGNIDATAAAKSDPDHTIGSIWDHPDRYEGRKVVLKGTYLGWRGQVESPNITRSDWAMRDDTGAIYVVGLPARGLDPVQDIGRPLEVTGIVKLNENSVPYIYAERVETAPAP